MGRFGSGDNGREERAESGKLPARDGRGGKIIETAERSRTGGGTGNRTDREKNRRRWNSGAPAVARALAGKGGSFRLALIGKKEKGEKKSRDQ